MSWKGMLASIYKDILEPENVIRYSIILVEDIPLFLKYNNKNKKNTYSFEHNKWLIALVSTSFGCQDHHHANGIQNLKKGCLHVMHALHVASLNLWRLTYVCEILFCLYLTENWGIFLIKQRVSNEIPFKSSI